LYQQVQRGGADELVHRHATLVKRIAWHLKGRMPASVDIGDLIQAGMIGLLEAARNYVPSRNSSFEAYAGIRIRGAMLDELRRIDWTPRSVYRRLREVMEAIRAIETETGREADEGEVAKRLGISRDEYAQIMDDASRSRVLSLSGDDDEGEAPVIDVADEVDAQPAALFEDSGRRKALGQAIAALPEREQLMMALYYDEELNLKEIGEVLGVSESRVCQLHGQALVRLRARLSDWRSGN
jgi:RNA polymerase sigma factor for flagellar operon FliA